MKHILALFSLLFCYFLASSQEIKDPFEHYKQQAEQEFAAYEEEVNRQWEAYEKANREAFEQFKKEVEAKWGKDNFTESSQKEWVEYSPDQTARSRVDFEKEEAEVEVLLSPEEAADESIVQQRLSEAVEELAVNRGKTKDYDHEIEQARPLSDEPVLKGQLQGPEGEEVTGENVGDFARTIVESTPIQTTSVRGTDDIERVAVSLRLPLAPNSIQTRAERFYADIQAYSERFDVPPIVIFAIMHTESYYNPKARSHVPAYGLMQIVPRSAGRDVYQFLHGQDKLVSANYLYDPTNNIEMGTAYVHLLLSRYFRRVTDPENRMLCAIAAYNTGAGNVSRAFIGTTRLSEAIPEINKLNPDQLFAYLVKHLPYQETRDYMQKVTSRMESYNQWLNQ